MGHDKAVFVGLLLVMIGLVGLGLLFGGFPGQTLITGGTVKDVDAGFSSGTTFTLIAVGALIAIIIAIVATRSRSK